MISKAISILSFLLVSLCNFAQANKVDSLLGILSNAKNDTTKVLALDGLFLEYEFIDQKKAKNYLDDALKLAEKIKFTKGIALTHSYLGYYSDDISSYKKAIYHYRIALKLHLKLKNFKNAGSDFRQIAIVNFYQGNTTDALQNFTEALVMFKKINYQLGISDVYSNLAVIYMNQGNYQKSLDYHFKGLKIREELKDTPGMAATYNNLGVIFKKQMNFDLALQYHNKSLKIKESNNDKTGIAISLSNIGIIKTEQGKFHEALTYHQKAILLREELNNQKGIAESYSAIGNVYFFTAYKKNKTDKNSDNFNNAIKYYSKSLEINIKIGSKIGQAGAYCNLANTLTLQRKFNIAEEYFLKAIKIADELKYAEYLRDLYFGYAKLDSTRNNFKGAFESKKRYLFYRDSLNNNETDRLILESQMNYEFEKKKAIAMAEHNKEVENQHKLNSEKNRKQKVVITFVVCGLLLVVVFAGFIFRSLKKTKKQKKIIEEQKILVEQQKQEVELQKELIEEQQREVLDSIHYAKRIQIALLPSQKSIEKNMNRLSKIE